MKTQKLYRSRLNKVIGGVCGGLAEYFDVDPVIIRVLFVLMVLFGGSGILLYFAAMIIIPKKPFSFTESSESTQTNQPSQINFNYNKTRNVLGIVLVVIGVLLLLANMQIFNFFDFFSDSIDFIFPILLIVLGMALIYYRQIQKEKTDKPHENNNDLNNTSYQKSYRQFRRSIFDKKIFGVCGGLANYFDIDSSLIRMLYVVLCFASFGAGLLIYLLIALIVPYDNTLNPSAP